MKALRQLNLIQRSSPMVKTIGTVMVLNLVLAIIAFVKDVFLAVYMGTTAEADALLLAYFIPDTIGNNLLAMAIGISCVPVFSFLHIEEKRDRLLNVLRTITFYTLAVTLLMVLFFWVFKDKTIELLGMGMDSETKKLCTKLFVVILPTLLFFPLVSVGTSILQVQHRFTIPAAAPILFNFVFLMGIVFPMLLKVEQEAGAYIVATAILLGTFGMWGMIFIPSLHIYQKAFTSGFRVQMLFPKKEIRQDIKAVLTVFFPYGFTLLMTLSVLFVERGIASRISTGVIAGLNYSFRLTQFPTWVFATAISAVVLPKMSQAIAAGEHDKLRQISGKALKYIIILSIPMVMILFIFRIPVLTILFQHGKFDAGSLQITSDVMGGFALAILGQSVVYVGLRYFIAIKKMIFPVFVLALSALLNIILDVFLVRIMGVSALGYGTAICYTVSGILIVLLIKKTVFFKLRNQISYFYKIGLASIPAIGILWLGNGLWGSIGRNGLIIQALYVMGVIGICIGVYIIILIGVKVFPLQAKPADTVEINQKII